MGGGGPLSSRGQLVAGVGVSGGTPRWQKWLREMQPSTMLVWGKYDPSFTVAGAAAYAGDVPNAEIHILEAGHFALDEATDRLPLWSATFSNAYSSTNNIVNSMAPETSEVRADLPPVNHPTLIV